jgi:hypothetical protein
MIGKVIQLVRNSQKGNKGIACIQGKGTLIVDDHAEAGTRLLFLLFYYKRVCVSNSLLQTRFFNNRQECQLKQKTLLLTH